MPAFQKIPKAFIGAIKKLNYSPRRTSAKSQQNAPGKTKKKKKKKKKKTAGKATNWTSERPQKSKLSGLTMIFQLLSGWTGHAQHEKGSPAARQYNDRLKQALLTWTLSKVRKILNSASLLIYVDPTKNHCIEAISVSPYRTKQKLLTENHQIFSIPIEYLRVAKSIRSKKPLCSSS